MPEPHPLSPLPIPHKVGLMLNGSFMGFFFSWRSTYQCSELTNLTRKCKEHNYNSPVPVCHILFLICLVFLASLYLCSSSLTLFCWNSDREKIRIKAFCKVTISSYCNSNGIFWNKKILHILVSTWALVKRKKPFIIPHWRTNTTSPKWWYEVS